ncbi:MAG: Rho termination factor N-terminal domain-containing protein [Snowella sp.]
MDTIIVLTALYILLIALIYAPKCPATSPAPDYVDYFPSVEDVTAGDDLETKTETIADLNLETAIAPEPSPAPDLDKAEDKLMLTLMSIRDLKKLASQAKIKNYSNLTKSQLIDRLALA